MPDVFLRTVLVQNRAEAADRTFQEDLPVNPLSQILVTLRGDIDTVNTNEPLADFLNTVTSLGVMFRGQDVVRGSLRDLAVLNAILTGQAPFGQRVQDAATETWSLTVPINFGRVPYMGEECFPAVKRGDLRLEMTLDVQSVDVDLLELQIETVELLNASPARFLKYTTNNVTFGTTGQEVVRLPIGNPLLGCLLFSTTVPTAALTTATWEQLRTKVDNVEAFFARANWDTLQGDMLRRIKSDLAFLSQHLHRVDSTTVTDAFVSSLGPIRAGASGMLEQYAYLDLDPLKDSSYMLETAGRADVVIQRDAGVADAGRFIPVELVTVAAQ
jgi:hypothetical protein